jgi:hypothetical protein
MSKGVNGYMKQLKRIALAVAVIAASFAATTDAQTNVTYVTNAYELKVQQFSAGTLPDGSRYAAFGGEAKAVNNKVAADLKGFAFTVFYDTDASGTVSVTGGVFLIQTVNKDRSPLVVGGTILPGETLTLQPNGWIVTGETLSLPLLGTDGSGINGTITATIDKSNPPRAAGTLSLTYPVVQ